MKDQAAGSKASRRRTGRRPAGGDTRAAILTAARDEFAANGYTRATIASIARRAGCDSALVHYFFGTKHDLFDAAIALPYDTGDLLMKALRQVQVPTPAGAGSERDEGTSRRGLGARLVEQVLSSWETDENRSTMVALMRSAASEEDAREAVHDLIVRKALLPAVEVLGVPDAERRAVLIGSLIYGLMIVRHVVRMEPIASDPPEHLARAVGPVVERYLFDDLEAED